jgi:hypothetical protein
VDGRFQTMIWWSILNLVIIMVVVAAPILAIGYGFLAFIWGFKRFPKTTGLVAALLVLGLISAAANFYRLFPNCHPNPWRSSMGLVRCN